MNKVKHKLQSVIKLATKLPSKPFHRLLWFTVVFAAVGGTILLLRTEAAVTYAPNPPHAATCVENSPSKTIVRPGETFTARIRIRNSGSSTFSGKFGIALWEFRDGGAVWNATGTNLSNDVGPGGIATFNITVRAPSQPGNYSFNWGMGIVFTGYVRNPCTGRSILVTNPPAVSLTANNQTGTLNLTRGNGLTLAWSATNNPTNCTASGSWSGGKAASGSENRSGDTTTAGTKTYTLACSNGAGTGSATRTVNIHNPPSSPPPPSPGRPSTPSSPRGSTPTPTNPAQPPQQDPNPTPPVPTGFSATVEDDVAVQLRWDRPNYAGILQNYEIDRSADNETWQVLGSDLITNESFTDTTTQFETTYYYRLRAVDQGGEKSEYATTEVTTPPFLPNTSAEGTTLNSDDGLVSVFIPSDAIDEDASCSLQGNYDVSIPSQKDFVTVSGPYEVICKTASGNKIATFSKPLQVTVSSPNTNYSQFAYYILDEQHEWQSVKGDFTDGKGSFNLENSTSFAVLGKKKSMPTFIKIMIFLVVIGGVAFGALLAVNFYGRWRQAKAIENRNEDYHRKELGL